MAAGDADDDLSFRIHSLCLDDGSRIDFDRLYEAVDAELKRFERRGQHHIACAGIGNNDRVLTAINLVSELGPGSTCAEQALLSEAVRQEITPLSGLIVVRATFNVNNPRELVAPCGRCRELLLQYSPELLILIPGTTGDPTPTSIDALLPSPFRRRAVAVTS